MKIKMYFFAFGLLPVFSVQAGLSELLETLANEDVVIRPKLDNNTTDTFGDFKLRGGDGVDTSQALSNIESEYVAMREQVAKRALMSLLKMDMPTDAKFPKIALCLSGGGFRAMISSLGLMTATQQIGLFDCISYMSGLSGSTWAILPMVLRNLQPGQYSGVLKQRICSSEVNKDGIVSKLVSKVVHFNKFKFVDFWGHFISEKLFGDLWTEQPITFRDIRTVLAHNCEFPFPLCSTVIGQTAPRYRWLEVNPFYVYSDIIGASVPTQIFGNDFCQGKLMSERPELDLEFFIGMFGSAFCLSFGDIVGHLTREFLDFVNLDLVKLSSENDYYVRFVNRFEYVHRKLGAYSKRLFAAKLPNYSYKLESSKVRKEKKLSLVDAGVAYNLPFPPLFRSGRNIDIFVVCDASADSSDMDFTQLRFVADWAYREGVKFPTLKKYKIVAPNLKIFYENDPSVPMIIYFANTIDEGTTDTTYSQKQFDAVFGNAFDTVFNAAEYIVEAVKMKMGIAPCGFDVIPDADLPKYHCTLV